jgi:homoserine O-acetyltransferase
MEHKLFDLGDFSLQKGSILPSARLGYTTLGELNTAKDNVVICPTWFTATPAETAAGMAGENRALQPSKYFIIVPNHFGAAVSSSPSNTPPPFGRGLFPRVTTYDNINAQYRLVTEVFGIEKIRLVSSLSMGAAQTYAWAALHPEMVQAIAPIAGSARTGQYNKVFLHALVRSITADPDWNDGFYSDKPPVRGLRTFASIYAGWGFSEAFYREELYRRFGADSIEEFIEIFWEPAILACDANDLLAQIRTWMHNDVGDHPNFGGDFDAALGAIQARTIIMNAETDRYFPPVDSQYEADRIKGAITRPIPTIWGHLASLNPADRAFIDRGISELLAD